MSTGKRPVPTVSRSRAREGFRFQPFFRKFVKEDEYLYGFRSSGPKNSPCRGYPFSPLTPYAVRNPWSA